MNLIIRQAEEKDIKPIAEIDKISFSVPWSEKSFEQEIMNNRLAFYIVAEVGDKIVGYAGLWLVDTEGHITNVAVHPEFRRKRIAEALISVLISNTIKNGAVSHTLEVRASNEAAISLYSKFGFKPAGIRRSYYEDNGEDAIIMWRIEEI